MKEGKPIWGIVGLAVVILAVVAVVFIAISHNRPSEVTPGTAEIILETSGGVSYEWKYEIVDTSVVAYDGVSTKDLDPDSDGGRIEETHKFKAVKSGDTDIVFKYVNFAGDNEEPTQTKKYHATVDQDLKIKITEIAEE